MSGPGSPVPSIRDREARLTAILETSIDGIVTIDERGIIESMNQAAADLFGYEPADLLGENISLLMPEPDRSAHDGHIARYLREGEPHIIGTGREVKGRRKDGTIFPFYLSVSEVLMSEGHRVFCGVMHDLTAVRGAQAGFDALLDSAVDAIFIIDDKGIIQRVNPSGEELFGYRPGELEGQNVSVLMTAPHRDAHDGYIERFLQTGEGRIIGKGRVVPCRKKSGATFDAWLSVGKFEVAGHTHFTGVVHDLSDLRAAEDELARTRQMAMLGEMSAAIAHEIKNPLAATSAALQVLRSGFGHKDRKAAIIDRIIERVSDLDGTVRRLLAFAKTWEPNRRRVPLGALLEPVLHLVEDDPRFAELHVSLELVEGAELFVDPELASQVFVNLVQNAGEAARGKGKIQIQHVHADGGHRISVVDDGPGMTDAVKARVLEPFFTTKASGTGLGLAICQKILRAHGGSLELESREGEGTAVHLFFPALPG